VDRPLRGWGGARRALPRWGGARRALPVTLAAALLLFLALASPAAAREAYVHGGIDDCGDCHPDNHTRWTPVSEVCLTCHPGYALPSSGATCWTCHTPAQDMGGAKDDTACVSACHLPGGRIISHSPHPDKATACTGCHPVSLSPTDANGGKHHVPPAPAPPVVGSFLPTTGAPGADVVVTGEHLSRVAAVSFAGIAAAFDIVSDERLVATVPEGAGSGPIAVSGPGGAATSATDFVVVVPPAAPAIASFVPTAGLRGTLVTVRGSGFSDVTAVTFNGTPTAFDVVSAGEFTATVPAGATSGPIAVNSPAGSVASASEFTVLAPTKASLTLKLSRTRLALGNSLKAYGKLRPASVAASTVKLTVQRRVNGIWRTVRSASAATDGSGAYAWRHKPSRRGSYRLRTTLAATVAHTSARTGWAAFSVR
jgi:hypothetical protein